MEGYGERIKKAREAAGLTQKQLGEKVGVTGVAITRYEKEQREPKYELLNKIASALDVSTGYIDGYETMDSHKLYDALRRKDFRALSALTGLPEDSFAVIPEEEEQKINAAFEQRKRETDININKLKFVIHINYNHFTSEDYFMVKSLIDAFSNLNHEGQKEAIRAIKIIAGNPEFQKSTPHIKRINKDEDDPHDEDPQQ